MKYEYKVSQQFWQSSSRLKKETEYLNSMGADGWKLINVESVSHIDTMLKEYTFIREVK